jgi:hypothetical protein
MSEELPPLWALDKAAEAAGFSSWRESKIINVEGSSLYFSIRAHARTIAQWEQPPVDEDWEAFARILNAYNGMTLPASDYASGKFAQLGFAQFKRELEARK